MNRERISLIIVAMCATGCHHNNKIWSSVPVAPPPDKEFNLIWSESDLNGLPNNPRWGLQESSNSEPPAQTPAECVREPYKPSCTIQLVVQDKPGFPNNLICVPFIPQSKIHGHVDWMPAQVTGLGAWLNFADDWDYNLLLLPTDDSGAEIQNGYTKNNNTFGGSQYMEVEFASEETVDGFVTPWWTHFRTVVATLDKKAAERELYPANDETLPRTVAVGLFGLDCEHDCRSELHPVYALAVEVSEDPDDNVWAIFARNWGTGGFCSSLNHDVLFQNGTLNILLPRKSHGMVEVDSRATQFAGTSTVEFPKVSQIIGRGTVLTFHLPDPSQKPIVEMLLHLKWSNDDVRARPTLPTPSFSTVTSAVRELETAAESETSEGYLGGLLQHKIGSRLSVAPLNRSAVATPSTTSVKTVPQVTVMRYKTTESRKLTSIPAIKNQEAKTKLNRDAQKILAVCTAYDDNPPTDRIPNFPDICKQLRSGQ